VAKAYWVSLYHSVSDAGKVAAYARFAVPVIKAGGGHVLAGNMPAKVYEAGIKQNVVIVEFNSLADAQATYDSPAYQAALEILAGACVRDLRIVEGLEQTTFR